ncbi:delta-endotoxin CytB [Marasmius fiardii PR-910]|nr:delta-endotoxin CytB [Marasmius fiardii PR-910]
MSTENAPNNENKDALIRLNVEAGAESIPFDSLSKLEPGLVPTALQVSKFASHYLHIETNPRWFDWDSFIQAISRYAGDDLVLVAIEDRQPMSSDSSSGRYLFKIASNDPSALPRAPPLGIPIPVTEIVDWIAYIITSVVGMPFDRPPVHAIVENAFTNLKWATESGFADFHSSSTGTNSSYEYRVQFAAPIGGSSDLFLSFVSTLALEADIKTESSWWGLTSSTEAKFVARIVGIKVRVTKGFMDPYPRFMSVRLDG